MAERTQLLSLLATTVSDYRAGEIPPLTPDHIDKWVCQFPGDVQIPMLRELNHVLRQMYFSRTKVEDFLGNLVMDRGVAGANPGEFWRAANFLRIQRNGSSQREMLTLFDRILNARYGFTTDLCGSGEGAFIYLDDALFSGDRVRNDLEAWIRNQAPEAAVLHIIMIAIHESGEWLIQKPLSNATVESGKSIDIRFWYDIAVENRKFQKNNSEVLWPAVLPDNADLRSYVAALNPKFPFEPRVPGGRLGPFSSEEGRQLLERELLLAGMKIRSFSANPSGKMRPLGYGPFGLGLGSMIVTFRNCPNNCPLALWWGDPEAGASSPLSKWYPLFPRKTYSQEVDWDDIR